MKNLWLIILLSGCGGEDEPDRPIIPQDEPTCLSCGYVPEDTPTDLPEPIPHLSAVPNELMFYYFLDSEYPFQPQQTRIFNITDEVVTMSSAYIETGTFGYVPCDNSFEIVDTVFPQVIQPGAYGTIWINFIWTLDVTFATLKVITDFDGLAETDVSLSGKVFNMSSDDF